MDRAHNLDATGVQHSFLGSNGNGRSQDMAISTRDVHLCFVVPIDMCGNNLDHTLMTDDEIIAVVMAHKEGKKIEMRHDESETWYPLAHTIRGEAGWNFHAYQYRVAPEPQHLEEIWLQHECGNIWRQIGWGIGIHFRVVKNTTTIQEMMEHATGFKND